MTHDIQATIRKSLRFNLGANLDTDVAIDIATADALLNASVDWVLRAAKPPCTFESCVNEYSVSLRNLSLLFAKVADDVLELKRLTYARRLWDYTERLSRLLCILFTEEELTPIRKYILQEEASEKQLLQGTHFLSCRALCMENFLANNGCIEALKTFHVRFPKPHQKGEIPA